MWPPSSSVPGANRDAAFGARAAAHDRARAMPVPILVDDFLGERRRLMASKIKEWFELL